MQKLEWKCGNIIGVTKWQSYMFALVACMASMATIFGAGKSYGAQQVLEHGLARVAKTCMSENVVMRSKKSCCRTC